MKKKELGIAVVGSGRIGSLRARLAAEHPAVGFVAVSDRDPACARALAGKVAAQYHSADNLEAISRPEVNAVIVSTSESEHTEAVLAAIRLGKPVLVEKPIALSLLRPTGSSPPPKRRASRSAWPTAAGTRNAT